MPSMPATSKKGGLCIGFPDVCLVPGSPPIPTPFPNMGEVNGADGTIAGVLIANKETVVESSTIPSSKGDEAGTGGGVMSGTNRDEVQFKQHSSKVYASNKKMVFHTAMTAHNGASANLPVGVQAVPSQVKVRVAM